MSTSLNNIILFVPNIQTQHAFYGFTISSNDNISDVLGIILNTLLLNWVQYLVHLDLNLKWASVGLKKFSDLFKSLSTLDV